MAIWTEGREKPSGVEGGWQTSEGSEQKCMQRGEPYERTYRRRDRSIKPRHLPQEEEDARTREQPHSKVCRGKVAGANNTRKHLGLGGTEFGWI